MVEAVATFELGVVYCCMRTVFAAPATANLASVAPRVGGSLTSPSVDER